MILLWTKYEWTTTGSSTLWLWGDRERSGVQKHQIHLLNSVCTWSRKVAMPVPGNTLVQINFTHSLTIEGNTVGGGSLPCKAIVVSLVSIKGKGKKWTRSFSHQFSLFLHTYCEHNILLCLPCVSSLCYIIHEISCIIGMHEYDGSHKNSIGDFFNMIIRGYTTDRDGLI